MTEKCKHSLIKRTCSLCLGKSQSFAESGRGVPAWFANHAQLAQRTSYIAHLIKGYTSDEVEEMMPRGGASATSPSYKRRSKDPKTSSQYLRMRKEG
jgi:hypothetical protein